MANPHPLAALPQILVSPSHEAGVPREVEDDLRVAGCMLVQEAGIMLELPQSTMATAQVLFHRFFYVSSMTSFGINDTAVAALYLSSKLNETPVRLRELINTFIYLTARIKYLLSLPKDYDLSSFALRGAGPSRHGEASGNGNGTNGKGKEKDIWEEFNFNIPGFHDPIFWEWKDVIVASEMQILKRLGFNMQVDLPYSHVINYCKILDLVFEPDVAQTAWSILNDALLTPLYAIHPPHTLACAAIHLTTRLHRIPLPDDWWLLFDVSFDDMHNCAGTVMSLWHNWGLKPVAVGRGDPEDEARWSEGREEREARWRRAWILAQSRRAVRRWIEERESR